jgi:hypothetical protein
MYTKGSSPVSAKYTPPHLRNTPTSPLSDQDDDNSRLKSPTAGKMDIDSIPVSLKQKLSPRGNKLWYDMLDDDTLPAPLPDIGQDSLKEPSYYRKPGPDMHSQFNENINRPTLRDVSNKENYKPCQAMKKLYTGMEEESTEEQTAVSTRNRRLAVAKHNALIGKVDSGRRVLMEEELRKVVIPELAKNKHSQEDEDKHNAPENKSKSTANTNEKQNNEKLINTAKRTNQTESHVPSQTGQRNQEYTRSYTRDDLELDSQANYTESLINQIKRMNLKPPTRLNGQTKYKAFEELEEQWERSPHLTVVMDDEVTEHYIQNLLDTALVFYFNSNPPQFRAFTEWAEWAFEQLRGWRIYRADKIPGKEFLCSQI